jgi:hypothetical protein
MRAPVARPDRTWSRIARTALTSRPSPKKSGSGAQPIGSIKPLAITTPGVSYFQRVLFAGAAVPARTLRKVARAREAFTALHRERAVPEFVAQGRVLFHAPLLDR